MFKHLLLPTDGSEIALRGVKLGIELARATKAQVTAIHVIQPFHAVSYLAEVLTATEATYMAGAVERAEQYLAEVKDLANAAAVPCDSHYEVSDLPEEIIAHSARVRHCDLVVMASHGRHGMSRLLMGSVTHKVLLTSPVPVLVCR